MKIRIWSDLHIDGARMAFSQNCQDEVLVLAGDTANSLERMLDFCQDIRDKFKAVVVIAGNHEYYRGDKWTEFKMAAHVECARMGNVHFLDEDHVIIEDVTFIGATLWTNFNNSDPACIIEAKRCINDFKFMQTGEHSGLVNVDWMLRENKHNINYIRNVCNNVSGKKVVVTHFPPIRDFQHPRWGDLRKNPLNGYFMSDLGHEIQDLEFDLWVSGHTHDSADFKKWGKRFVCNPRGYLYRGNAENIGWDVNKVLEV